MEESFTPDPSLPDTSKVERQKEAVQTNRLLPSESVIRNILNYSKALSVLRPKTGTFLVIGN